ncbi:cystatin-like protein [Drosophila nasuta]|uniref:cystatin-like protein n=1 Tax=Drosophila nasuta TaxID=42062 RepID=UPI00295EF0E1|nr:cystatin-like protein [Drosophila nasuta]
MADRGDNLCGGIRQIDGENREEALDLLKKTLETLATGDGPSLKVVNVTSVSSQVVAGTLYRYKVQLSQDDNVKESYVEIWSQPWLKENGTNIKIKFDGEENNSVDKTF